MSILLYQGFFIPWLRTQVTSEVDLHSNRGFIPFMKLLQDKNLCKGVSYALKEEAFCTRILPHTADNLVKAAWSSP